jgi:phage recombination protein Bet
MTERAIATVAPPLAAVRDEWDQERIEFVLKNYCSGAPAPLAATFVQLCRRRNLAPEERQVCLTRRGDDWVIQTTIDGYRLIAERTGRYAGSDPAVYHGEGALPGGGKPYPLAAAVTVWRLVDGQRCPFTAAVRWDEFCPGGKQAFMWHRMPYHMLGKVAESHALRKAFPADLSNIYTDDEMDQAGPALAAPREPERRAAPPSPEVTAYRLPPVEPSGAKVDVAADEPIEVDLATGEVVGHRPSLNRLHAVGAERGLDHHALHDLAARWFDVASMKDLTVDQVTDLESLVGRFSPEEWTALRRMVESQDANGFGILMGYAVSLADARTGGELKQIAAEMAKGGVNEPALQAVGARRKHQLIRHAEMTTP